MDAKQWVAAFAEAIGMPAVDDEQFDAILKLAATAAHDSERTAAPVACWLVGSSGKSLEEANKTAEPIGGGS